MGDEAKVGLVNCQSLLVYDFKGRKWTTLANIPGIVNLAWSRDSQWIYFSAVERGPELYRVQIASKRIEPVVSLSIQGGGDWIGVAPDGSPLVFRDTRIDEVYALDVQWP